MSLDIKRQWLEIQDKYAPNLYGWKPSDEKYYDKVVETRSRADTRKIQDEKLRFLARYLWEYSPFYRKKFKGASLRPEDIRGIEDLKKFPITVKEEWVASTNERPPYGDYSSISPEEWKKIGAMLYTTSGTTSRPRAFMYTIHDWHMISYVLAMDFYAGGIKPGNLVLSTFPMTPAAGAWSPFYGILRIGVPQIATGAMPDERKVDFIKNFDVTVLLGTPSYILHLTDVAINMGVDPAKDTHVNLIFVTGEPGGAVTSTRRKIEEAWDALVVDYLGSTESHPNGMLCYEEAVASSEEMRPPNIHEVPEFIISEIIDEETFEPVSPGEKGLLVVTNIYLEATPCLRYLQGDYVIKDEEWQCVCGRTAAVFRGGLLGRSDDMMKIRGVGVYPTAIEEVVRSYKELGSEFRIIVDLNPETKMDELLVEIEPLPEIPREKWKELEVKVANDLRRAIGLRTNVKCIPFGTIPRTAFKARRVTDKRGR
jgi:phenylacetate-CoA ligase